MQLRALRARHGPSAGPNRLACTESGYYITENCAFGTVCTGAGQCTGCPEGDAFCSGTSRLVCIGGVYKTQNCGFGSVCVGQGQCSECQGNEAICSGTERRVCSNGLFVTMNCPAGTSCTGEGQCTTSTSCVVGSARCAAGGGREVCDNGVWVSSPCPAGTACSGTGECPIPGPAITNLVVNDTSLGNDGIANNTQWSPQATFVGGQRAFADRTFTIGAIPAAASHLVNKPWIRTAADSKSYDATPTLATANITGSFVYLAVDSRHGPGFLTGFTLQTYSLTVMEAGVARTYRLWKKAVTNSGGSFSLPSIGFNTAPCYFVIVE